jgi:predicted RND superfamily exporter protein
MNQFKILLPNKTFEEVFNLPNKIAVFTIKNKNLIWIVALMLCIISIYGGSKLKVENSFIDYFKSNTEIHKGMQVIDQSLGGTTLLDVTLDFANKEYIKTEPLSNEDEYDDIFEEFDGTSDDPKYWFSRDKMIKIESLHDYLDSLEYTGTVLSFATILKIGRMLNNGQDLDSVQLGLLYEKLPEEYKKIILNPYISTENNQAKITLRVKDSDPLLRRNQLINKINNEAYQIIGVENNQIRLSNILILYNNMLQSLFNSQIKTLGLVVLALFCMFLVLFRSLKISIIALIPNILSIGSVLGLMGIFSIPLDMMTITIAAISMGIAVDNTIHYIFRHKGEFLKYKNYEDAMKNTHNSIGYALYYTTLTIIVGFSILVFSNFIPSIYFGLLTSLAMIVALLASLTLVPRLLSLFKPYKI